MKYFFNPLQHFGIFCVFLNGRERSSVIPRNETKTEEKEMKNLTRLAAFALCLVLVLSLLPQASLTAHAQTVSGSCGSHLTWTLDTATGLLKISGSGEMDFYDPYSDNPAPWSAYCGSIKNISFPSGITSIGAYAFVDCVGLTKLDVPEGVTLIDWAAFSRCTGLTEVSLPASLKKIGVGAFGSCAALTSVTLSEGLKTVDGNAFSGCAALKSVTIPASVTSIDSMAFGYCYDPNTGAPTPVTNFTIYGYPDTAAQDYAESNGFTFVSLSGDLTIVSGTCGMDLTWTLDTSTGLLTIEGSGEMWEPDPEWGAYRTSVTAISFPEGLTAICFGAFSSFTELTSLSFPDSLVRIENGAFQECSSLSSVALNRGLKQIDDYAFISCNAMTSITIPTTVNEIGSYAFGYDVTPEGEIVKEEAFTIVGAPGTAAESYAEANGFTFDPALPKEPITGECGVDGDNLIWTFDEDTGVLTIEGSGAMAEYDPWDYIYNNGPDLCPPWFDYRESILEVVLPEGLTVIGGWAFFDCANLKSVNLPAGLTAIAHDAFRACPALTGIVFPESLTEIGYYAFNKCTALTGVIVPDGVTSVGEGAFYDCTGLTSAVLPEGITKLKMMLFSGCTKLTDVSLPESLTAIDEGAFKNCTSLQNLVVPEAVTTIGANAFGGCTSMESITLPAQMTAIGDGAFAGCSALTGIVVPEGVEELGLFVFSNCTNLQSITFPRSLKQIGEEVLTNNTALKSITLYEGLESIGSFAFHDCTALENLTLPEGLTSIGYYAFLNCPRMTSVTIPASVTAIDPYAFGYCYSYSSGRVEDFTICGVWDSEAMHYAIENEFYFVPTPESVPYSGSCGAAGDNLTWTFDKETGVLTIKGSGAMEDFTEKFCPWASHRESMTAVVLPEGITSVGDYAFSGCSTLTEIDVPIGVETIGCCAFWDCTGLARVSLPQGLKEISYSAFTNCSSLTEIALPEGLTVISSGTFSGCTGLSTVTLPDSLQTIDDFAFGECTALTGIFFPQGLKLIGGFAFAGCSGLTRLSFPEGLKRICGAAFRDCTGLTEVTIPEGVISIEFYAFCNCPLLTSVTLPMSVSLVNEAAFGYVDYQEKVENFTVYGAKNSVAQAYAQENGFHFVPIAVNNPFVDVKEEDFFFMPVMWAVSAKVTGGTDETHFSPNQTVQRCDSMVFFWAAKDRPEHFTEESPFKDVKKKHWYYDAVMWAVENEITGGTDATHFSPKQTCSRSEILQFLYAAEGKPAYTIDNPYSDVKNKHWYKDSAIWAYENGLEKGENGKFKAKTPCTRGYVVTYLYRYLTGLELAE